MTLYADRFASTPNKECMYQCTYMLVFAEAKTGMNNIYTPVTFFYNCTSPKNALSNTFVKKTR